MRASAAESRGVPYEMTSASPIHAEPWSFVDTLLADQQRLSAVETYSELHALGTIPEGTFYRDLIPLTAPSRGEQYAFEVELDRCSGCKACVAACHSMNGLEEGELWRTVGLLFGGSSSLPALQHVTTSCHHCVDPACLAGCPVKAYEKDPATGIVIHLDDQCIGCQYCILKCPYDAPKFSTAKGIVRKCDMCRQRLAVNEPPACVQACPNGAIRITLVDQHAVIEASEVNAFLPGAPEPGYTIPTTIYRTQRPLPPNLLPADYHASRPQHAHLPLVFMLVLTQASVGALVTDQLWVLVAPLLGFELIAPVRMAQAIAALLLGGAGLAASVLHLGRPLYAFRAIIGLRRSWLSREILAFTIFALAASAYAVVAGLSWMGTPGLGRAVSLLGITAAISGVLAVLCSVMIYVDTRRAYWSGPGTVFRFLATVLVLGAPASLLISLSAAIAGSFPVKQLMESQGTWLCGLLIGGASAKLLFESLIFAHLRGKRHTPLKRTALLLSGELSLTTLKRFFLGVVGGLVLPAILLAEASLAPAHGYSLLFVGVAAALSFLAVLTGELLERYLFFTAVVAPKMPGSPAS